MSKTQKLTPMQQQYKEFKATLEPNTLLFFRLGDFFELFFEDAIVGSKLLHTALTHRNNIPMAGIPYHALQMYLEITLAAGINAAICDVGEIPEPGNPVKRCITARFKAQQPSLATLEEKC